jgi:hypothetical protein
MTRQNRWNIIQQMVYNMYMVRINKGSSDYAKRKTGKETGIR